MGRTGWNDLGRLSCRCLLVLLHDTFVKGAPDGQCLMASLMGGQLLFFSLPGLTAALRQGWVLSLMQDGWWLMGRRGKRGTQCWGS